jgi:hypothetical protein
MKHNYCQFNSLALTSLSKDFGKLFPYHLSGHWMPKWTSYYNQHYIWRNLTLKECEDDIHIFEMGTWESFETLKNSEFDCRGQNTSSWCVFYIVGKVLKCRCRKWSCISHSDIYSTSYSQKKGWESNYRPLKVKNRPDPNVCRWIATHR